MNVSCAIVDERGIAIDAKWVKQLAAQTCLLCAGNYVARRRGYVRASMHTTAHADTGGMAVSECLLLQQQCAAAKRKAIHMPAGVV